MAWGFARLRRLSACSETWCERGSIGFGSTVSMACSICRDRDDRPIFPPLVAIEIVRIACTMPDELGRSLNLWTCADIARQLIATGVVDAIAPSTVQRILAAHKLKPWRSHYWLRAKAPRDADFIARTRAISEIYTRPLADNEIVLCVDEKTSLQPRIRLAPSKPAMPGRPVQIEHEYKRAGALNLFAALDTRSGHVYGMCFRRKRQVEFIQFLQHLDAAIPAAITHIHIVCDNLKTHSGKETRKWLAAHPRFEMHFTPVHCSWMNQVEQWFSILQRKRLAKPDFADLDHLANRIAAFIDEWNTTAEPFDWTTQSFAKIIAKAEANLAA